MNPITYIFFDNDGVLVDTEECYFRANQQAFSDIGLMLSREVYVNWMPKGGSVWNFAIEQNITEDVIKQQKIKRDAYYKHMISTEKISIPHVEEVIETLTKTFKMAIVTTSKRDDFNVIHDTRSITKHMEFCLTVEDYPRAKPHPDPYIKAMEIFGATPEECLVVEDSERGLESAYRAGIPCVIVKNDFVASQNFSKASYKINKFDELLDILPICIHNEK